MVSDRSAGEAAAKRPATAKCAATPLSVAQSPRSYAEVASFELCAEPAMSRLGRAVSALPGERGRFRCPRESGSSRADLEAFVGDPNYMETTPGQLLDDNFIATRRSMIDSGRAT